MSLVFCGITPHPPIIIPGIGGKDINKVLNTVNALKEMEGDLYVSQPETIIIISPHSPLMPETYLLNLASQFTTNLKEFGNIDPEKKYNCDLELISSIKEKADEDKIPVNIVTYTDLDHGVSVPLYYLTKHLPKIKIIPISYSYLDYESHFEFGDLLRRKILAVNKRVAIIASGDLSHRLTPSAQAGYSSSGKTFDHLLIKLLSENRIKEILKINPKLIEEAGECGLRSIIILLGVLNRLNYKFKKLSYEGPFGVGYLVSEFLTN